VPEPQSLSEACGAVAHHPVTEQIGCPPSCDRTNRQSTCAASSFGGQRRSNSECSRECSAAVAPPYKPTLRRPGISCGRRVARRTSLVPGCPEKMEGARNAGVGRSQACADCAGLSARTHGPRRLAAPRLAESLLEPQVRRNRPAYRWQVYAASVNLAALRGVCRLAPHDPRWADFSGAVPFSHLLGVQRLPTAVGVGQGVRVMTQQTPRPPYPVTRSRRARTTRLGPPHFRRASHTFPAATAPRPASCDAADALSWGAGCRNMIL
jgi:hypothetical protein